MSSWGSRQLSAAQSVSSLPFLLLQLMLTNPVTAGGVPIDHVPAVLSWCAGAVAALRSLQPLAALASQQEHLPRNTDALASSLLQLAGTCSWIGGLGGRVDADRWLRQAVMLRSASAAQRQELSAALFNLHTVACRAVHWAAAGEGGSLLRPWWQQELLHVLGTAKHEAWKLGQAAEGAEQQRSHLPAMAAAHWQAVAKLLGSQESVRQLAASDRHWPIVGHGLAAAAVICPPVAALQPASLAVLDCMLKLE